MLKIYPLLLALVFLLNLPLLSEETTPEFRALWVTRFEWPDLDPEICRQNIIKIFDDMEQANFNVALFQVRGAAEVLYPSEIEPWSQLVGAKDPGFDPLEFAIGEAHKRGMELHAYINPIPLYLWSKYQAPPPKTNPPHLYYTHGPESEDSWVCCDETGKIMGPVEYHYLSIGIPEVQSYLRKVIRDLVKRYSFDGLHLDRIRYPGKNFSHDPVSRKRFLGKGNPNRKDWGDWQREQMNKFVNDVYAEVKKEKPDLTVSCAAWGIYNRYHIPGYYDFSSGFHHYFQDTWSWIENGSMDLLIPMIYWNIPEPKPNYNELLVDFIRGVGKQRVAGGQRMYGEWPVKENIEEIRFSRDKEVYGHAIFSYSSAKEKNAFHLLREGVYAQKADVPSWPEASSGALLGKVVDQEGKPVVDAWVKIHSLGETKPSNNAFKKAWTSASDGRFAFLQISPQQVRIEVVYQGEKTLFPPLKIEKGKVQEFTCAISTREEQGFLHIFEPKADELIKKEKIHLLGRTSPGGKVLVNGKEVDVYPTGVFAYDNIPLKRGKNSIVVTAFIEGEELTRHLTVLRDKDSSSQKNLKEEKKELSLEEVIWENYQHRVVAATEDKTPITWGTHSVRLGGPFLSEVPEGTHLQVVGEKKNHYKIRFGESIFGWVSKKDVKALPPSTPTPSAHFTYCIISGEENYDKVEIPLSSPVAYSVSTGLENTLHLDFFNTHHATTWLSHKMTAQVVKTVSAEQKSDGWFRLHIPIKSKQIWGYWLEKEEEKLTLYIKHPPTLSEESIFKGLVFALEAGHGGEMNGAVGLMGTKEKDINFTAVELLQAELEALGAKTILVRVGDTQPSLRERVDIAIKGQADFYVSLHANAASSEKGFLRVSGTSTYYKHLHCNKLAQYIYKELLGLGWKEFGVVGNFNYRPLLNTRMVSVLVEQAFMSHPYDESRLLDQQYQKEQAKAIIRGMEMFLQEMKTQ